MKRDCACQSLTSIVKYLLALTTPLHFVLVASCKNQSAEVILAATPVVTPWGSRTIPPSISPSRMMGGRSSNNIRSLDGKSNESVVATAELTVTVMLTIIKTATTAKTHALLSGAGHLSPGILLRSAPTSVAFDDLAIPVQRAH